MADVKVPLPDAADRATRLLTQITNGEWSAARADFTDVVAGSLDEDGLRETWEHVTENLDGYQGTMGTPEITTKKLLTIVTVPLNFAAGELLGRVSYNPLGQVTGLYFVFHRSDAAPNPIVSGDYVLRCSDGHFYTVTWEVLTYRTAHWFSTQFRPCPVDGRWRAAHFVDRRVMTDAQRTEAAHNRVG
jgi:hypothetical protein